MCVCVATYRYYHVTTVQSFGTYGLRESGGVAHPVVAGERRRAVLRRAEPARLELLPAHVRETCKSTATGVCERRIRRIRRRSARGPTVDAEAVGEAPPVGGADELEALGEDPEPPLHLRRVAVPLPMPARRTRSYERSGRQGRRMASRRWGGIRGNRTGGGGAAPT